MVLLHSREVPFSEDVIPKSNKMIKIPPFHWCASYLISYGFSLVFPFKRTNMNVAVIQVDLAAIRAIHIIREKLNGSLFYDRQGREGLVGVACSDGVFCDLRLA